MRTIAAAAVMLAFVFPASSSAHFLSHGKLTLKEKVTYFTRSVAHDRARVHKDQRMLRQLVRAHYEQVLGARPVYALIAGRARWHRHAFRWHIRQLRRYTVKYQASLPPPLPPHHAEWGCIHGYEGSWDANTGNGFYGGLQMDLDFQSHYGPELLKAKGTADNWTPLEQMWVAERAYSSGRGFYPWPNTARYCGLI